MLARTYLTADELGISDQQLQALILVQEALERGDIEADPKFDKRRGLNMIVHIAQRNYCTRPVLGCGTTACIAGWAHILSGCKDIFPAALFAYGGPADVGPPGLEELFFGFHAGGVFVLPVHAARAIDNYRRTGFPNWKDACGV